MPDIDLMVLYDISDDPTRNLMVEHLEYQGLARIQYSVFRGMIPQGRLKAIVSGCRSICTDREDRVLIVPICASCRRRMIQIHDDHVTLHDERFVI
jgi:CRISPR-associated protein Cas2